MNAAGDPVPQPDRATRDAGLQVRDLACAAGSRVLFEEVSFDVGPGRWLMLTGPNGSGKTTLLRAVAGLIRPLAGEVAWRGRPRERGDARWRQALFYQGHLSGWKPEFAARENLLLQVALDQGGPPAAAVIDAALARVGLTRAARVQAARLSAGQTRRLCLARLQCTARPLWLLDEPANALDTDGLHLLSELLDQHLAGGGCAVVASHQPLAARRVPDRYELRRAGGPRRGQPSGDGSANDAGALQP